MQVYSLNFLGVSVSSIWESLDTQSFVNVLKQVLEIDVIGSYKKAIISGIFQQLYEEGESNDHLFYAHLLALSQDELKSQLQSTSITCKKIENKLEPLPDGLLSHIATYIKPTNVFSKWNHVNRKFLHIGLNPASIKHFEFNFNNSQKLKKDPPKFKYDVTLCKLESLSSFCYSTSTINKIADQISMQHLRALTISMSAFVGHRDTSILSVSDIETATCVERLVLRNREWFLHDKNGDVGKLFGF